ncbi:hypothetical protein E2I00_009502, partial [Balaenoptera physalus]
MEGGLGGGLGVLGGIMKPGCAEAAGAGPRLTQPSSWQTCPRSSKPSWADQVEEEGEDDKCVTSELLKGIPLAAGDTSPEPELLPGAPLPPPKEVINGNIKTLTEYKIDEDGKKFKVRLGKREEEDPMNKLKGQKIVSCRICKGDHWTTRCPYKDTLGPMQKELAEQLGLSTGEKEKLPGGARARGCGWQAVGWRTGIVCASGRVVGRQLASERDRHCWWLSPPTQQRPHCKAVTTGRVRLCERDWQALKESTDHLWFDRWCLGGAVAGAASILGQVCAGGGLTGPCIWSPELEPVQATQNKTGKYVPPSLRDGASRRGESMQPNRR